MAQNSELKLLMVEGQAYSQHIINAAKNNPVAKSVMDSSVIWFDFTEKMFEEFIDSRNFGNVLIFRTTFFLMARLSSKFERKCQSARCKRMRASWDLLQLKTIKYKLSAHAKLRVSWNLLRFKTIKSPITVDRGIMRFVS